MVDNSNYFEKSYAVKSSGVKKLNAMVMAAVPVLEAYGVSGSFPLSLALVGVILAFLFTFNDNGYVLDYSDYMKYVVNYPIILVLISCSAYVTTKWTISLTFSLIATFAGGCAIWFIWHNMDFEYFVKCSEIVAVICMVVTAIQILCIVTNREVPTGEIPFLYRNALWTTSTYGYRINALFSEPSYLAIYFLPLLAYELEHERYKKAIAVFVTIFISSSSLGIIGSLIIFGSYIYKRRGSVNVYKNIIFLLVFIIVLHYLAYNRIPYYTQSFDRSMKKITDIFQGNKEDNLRITGYISYYKQIPFINKFLGVGLFQLANYFDSIGTNIKNYGNTYVYGLMSHGLTSFFLMIRMHIRLFYDSKIVRVTIFWAIFVLVCMVDGWEFSYKYYYVLTFIMVPILKKEGF